MKQHVETLIRALEAEKKSIDRKLAIAYQLRDTPQLPADQKPAKGHRGAGFVALVLPMLEREGAQSVDTLFRFLKTHPGMRNVERASFESTLYSEVRKAKPRLRKVSPGVYAAMTGWAANPPELVDMAK